MMTLGDRIRIAREAADLSQGDLARLLRDADPRLARTSATRISDWERGATIRVPFHAVVEIAHATSKPLEFFASIDGGDS